MSAWDGGYMKTINIGEIEKNEDVVIKNDHLSAITGKSSATKNKCFISNTIRRMTDFKTKDIYHNAFLLDIKII